MLPQLKLISRAFSDAAASRAKESFFHSLLAAKLASQVMALGRKFRSCLEIGTHTGIQTREMLQAMDDNAKLLLTDIHAKGAKSIDGKACFFLVADGERAPFSGQPFELIFSGSAFQWFREPGAAVRNLLGLLEPGGILAFSIFLAPSLEPLRTAFSVAGEERRFLPLYSEEELREMLQGLGLASFKVLEEKRYYPDLRSMVGSIRDFGAGASAFRDQPIAPASLMLIKEVIEARRRTKGLPLKLKAAAVVLENR